jgi:hypothetical protein
MNDRFLDHPLLSARYFCPWPNRFDEPMFAAGNGLRLGCRSLRFRDDAPTMVRPPSRPLPPGITGVR